MEHTRISKYEDNSDIQEFNTVIKGLDEDEQVCYGEVYAPNVIDTYGDVMEADAVKEMAHRYMSLDNLKHTIDTNHDEIWNGSYPVESFIAREGDPLYTEGAWVLGVKVPDSQVWSKIKKGELNGYSFQARVRKKVAVAELDVYTQEFIISEEAEGHSHFVYVKYNADGRVVGGRTSTDMGHSHEVKSGTATSEEFGHAHRMVL